MTSAFLRMLTLCALLFASACSTSPTTAPIKAPSFNETLEKHIAAVTNRDLATYQSTLTNKNDLLLIFPNGKPLETTNSVVEFHRNWFKDADWIYEPSIVKVIEGSDMATAVIKYSYRDNAKSKPPVVLARDDLPIRKQRMATGA